MRILGIDPGLANTGYGLIDHDGHRSTLVASGCVVTPAGMAVHTRLRQIHDGMTAVIAQYKPDVASVEQLFFARNVTTAITVAQGRGVAMLAVAEADMALFEYTPLQIKQAITGSGKADKSQVILMVRAILSTAAQKVDLSSTSHAADALAVALCHAHSYRFHEMATAALARDAALRSRSRSRSRT